MNSKIRALQLLALAGTLFPGTTTGYSGNPGDIDVKPKPAPLPKGCKEYFFNEAGRFSTDKMLRSECVFKCNASNDKNAIRKFENWKKGII